MATSEEGTVSELFLSVIMRPVRYPVCFAALTNIYTTVEINGLDVNAVANAIGTFLNDPEVNYLYICGRRHSHADGFFEDLRNALDEEPEIQFIPRVTDIERGGPPKKIVRVTRANAVVPTRPHQHRILEFGNSVDPYDNFGSDELCSFVYCGNSEDGPVEKFACKNEDGKLCVDRRISGREPCGSCFWVPLKGKLEEPTLMDFLGGETDHETDDGIVAHPLGIPPKVYRDILSTTDSD